MDWTILVFLFIAGVAFSVMVHLVWTYGANKVLKVAVAGFYGFIAGPIVAFMTSLWWYAVIKDMDALQVFPQPFVLGTAVPIWIIQIALGHVIWRSFGFRGLPTTAQRVTYLASANVNDFVHGGSIFTAIFFPDESLLVGMVSGEPFASIPEGPMKWRSVEDITVPHTLLKNARILLTTSKAVSNDLQTTLPAVFNASTLQ